MDTKTAKKMDTKAVADKWASMCREGKNLECIEEIYAENITSREMPGMPNEKVSGKKNVWKKNKEWLDNVKEMHDGKIDDPVIADNHFTSRMWYDVTFKDRGRQQMEELGVFEVKDGKIANEQFFYGT